MLEVVTRPVVYPVSLSEAKDFLKVDGYDEDDLILACIEGAVDIFERSTGLALIYQTLKQTFDTYCDDGLELFRSPIISISTISYKDEDGNSQTYSTSNVYVEKRHGYPKVQLKENQTFPDVSGETNNIEITFIAGYGDSFDVPEGIKTDLKYLIKQYYDCRGDAVRMLPTISDRIMSKYKIYVPAL